MLIWGYNIEKAQVLANLQQRPIRGHIEDG